MVSKYTATTQDTWVLPSVATSIDLSTQPSTPFAPSTPSIPITPSIPDISSILSTASTVSSPHVHIKQGTGTPVSMPSHQDTESSSGCQQGYLTAEKLHQYVKDNFSHCHFPNEEKKRAAEKLQDSVEECERVLLVTSLADTLQDALKANRSIAEQLPSCQEETAFLQDKLDKLDSRVPCEGTVHSVGPRRVGRSMMEEDYDRGGIYGVGWLGGHICNLGGLRHVALSTEMDTVTMDYHLKQIRKKVDSETDMEESRKTALEHNIRTLQKSVTALRDYRRIGGSVWDPHAEPRRKGLQA
ncbi:hypothetical protein CI109_100913 [Kwoniella shandongensis]|uniref:Uncharacterized protein n=1 Tax=Kwoniella shandongensis TaxID=1734106 RepID=A0A5M6C485_9TREE|nr:uncharacterized protein CI109_001379 [Kwoniella shandongensis]KAA5529977.1 hypothetical protein CI109_001379 [Kwoniella shandongensis]